MLGKKKSLLASEEKKKGVCSELSEAVGHRGLQEALLKQTSHIGQDTLVYKDKPSSEFVP